LQINELKRFSAFCNSIPRCAKSFFTARNEFSAQLFNPRCADSFRTAETPIRVPRNGFALPRVIPRAEESFRVANNNRAC